jgi:hypothetical protein
VGTIVPNSGHTPVHVGLGMSRVTGAVQRVATPALRLKDLALTAGARRGVGYSRLLLGIRRIA